MQDKHVITVKVKNNAGVLARVASLFGRRGYNIESLTVSATDDPSISRMTVVVKGDEDILAQIIHQTAKLEESLAVYALDPAGRSTGSCCSLSSPAATRPARRCAKSVISTAPRSSTCRSPRWWWS